MEWIVFDVDDDDDDDEPYTYSMQYDDIGKN